MPMSQLFDLPSELEAFQAAISCLQSFSDSDAFAWRLARFEETVSRSSRLMGRLISPDEWEDALDHLRKRCMFSIRPRPLKEPVPAKLLLDVDDCEQTDAFHWRWLSGLRTSNSEDFGDAWVQSYCLSWAMSRLACDRWFLNT